MLFDKSRHEPLSKRSWDQNIVQAEISSVIDDIEGSVLPEACWPTHPLDGESYPTAGPKWSAYAGAAGTIHTLQILARYGYKVSDLSGLIETVYQSFLRKPDVSVEPGLQIGELGILMPAILAKPDDKKLANLVMGCMEATLQLPLYEITSGQTGMMHAALALYRKTAEHHWKDLYVKGANALLDNWRQDENSGEWLWQSQVFGAKRHYYGACHGTSGNGYAFLYLYRRSGKTLWLDRAKQFAMHAIEQCQKARLDYGQGRYTLWTGDAGLAIYLYHCLDPETAAIPGLDLF